MRGPSLQLRFFLLLLAGAVLALLVHAALVVWPLPPLLQWLGHDASSVGVIVPWSVGALTLTAVLLLPVLWWLAQDRAFREEHYLRLRFLQRCGALVEGHVFFWRVQEIYYTR